METYEQLTLGTFLNATFTAEDFHVRLSRLQEEDEALKIQEELYSLRSCGLLDNESLALYSLKMSKDSSTMRGGDTFETIITTMAELGYGVEWQVLNSKYFGVPQNRERVFIVGHLGGICGGQVFPITEDFEQTHELQRQEVLPQVVAGTLDTRIDALTNGTYPLSGGGYSEDNREALFGGFRGVQRIDEFQTVEARYYKGVCNQGINLVRENDNSDTDEC